jgi:DNA-binding transcriptional LysR family regulator
MHRRYQYINIPTEIIRSIVVIAETSSFSKAAERLGLTQPAISAQVKRLQLLVGGAVFERNGAGVAFTPKGKLVLSYARKLLEANDQILSLGGIASDARPIRVGIAAIFVEYFLDNWDMASDNEQVSFACQHSSELVKLFEDGHLDVALLANHSEAASEPLFAWDEEFVWARGKSFALLPGSPIPLIGWPGMSADQAVFQTLERAGLSYRIAFTSGDRHARYAAAAKGLGLMGVPIRQVSDQLIVAEESYLPALRPLRLGIFVRPGFDRRHSSSVIDALKKLAPSIKSEKAIA